MYPAGHATPLIYIPILRCGTKRRWVGGWWVWKIPPIRYLPSGSAPSRAVDIARRIALFAVRITRRITRRIYSRRAPNEQKIDDKSFPNGANRRGQFVRILATMPGGKSGAQKQQRVKKVTAQGNRKDRNNADNYLGEKLVTETLPEAKKLASALAGQKDGKSFIVVWYYLILLSRALPRSQSHECVIEPDGKSISTNPIKKITDEYYLYPFFVLFFKIHIPCGFWEFNVTSNSLSNSVLYTLARYCADRRWNPSLNPASDNSNSSGGRLLLRRITTSGRFLQTNILATTTIPSISNMAADANITNTNVRLIELELTISLDNPAQN